MFFLSRPTAQRIARFRQTATQDSFSYPEVGATLEGSFPDGYNLDRNRIRLGEGSGTFERAFAALCEWKMFDIGWVELLHPPEPIVPGQTVLVLARTFGLYSLSANRVIGMIEDDSGHLQRRGFSYGTLQHHVERGEERQRSRLRGMPERVNPFPGRCPRRHRCGRLIGDAGPIIEATVLRPKQ